MVNPSFWHSKRVFVTGHTGFKGSWLSLWLHALGAEVTGFSLEPPTKPSLFELAELESITTSTIGDVRDYGAVKETIERHRPEIVIHMAAQPLVRLSYREPVETYATNVMGTAHVLEAVRQVGGVRAVVIVTSDKCYDNREWLWGYRESEPMGGYDPYSSSKGCAELVTSAYRSSYFPLEKLKAHGTAVASARAGNVIGGGDWAHDRLIPDLIRGFMAEKPVPIRNPQAIRPWQHVLEPLSGYLMLAERLYQGEAAYAEAWNFGPLEDDAKPVAWIADYLSDLWGPQASWHVEEGDHPHEAHYLKLDWSKAKMRLGWKPRWRLEKTLESIAEWHGKYRGDPSVKAVRAVSLAQIEAYASRDGETHAQH